MKGRQLLNGQFKLQGATKRFQRQDYEKIDQDIHKGENDRERERERESMRENEREHERA